MGVGQVSTGDLDDFVEECDRLGGIAHPEARSFVADFSLDFDTAVDTGLDPFSSAYAEQQVALYTEIARRPLDQNANELLSFDVEPLARAANPYASNDVRFISRQVRAIQTCVMMAHLPPCARVLDMGSGWGLSSEAIAFTGAQVTAVDINPLFVELVRGRAERLGLPIDAHVGTFDSFQDDRTFDMLFFYECLHHSTDVVRTLSHLAPLVAPDGKIVFGGEPINQHWWPGWGLRLDPESVYCMRKHGWWESGWSEPHIVQCFARAGWDLQMFPHVGLDNGSVGIATRTGLDPAPTLDTSVMEPYGPAHDVRDALIWRAALAARREAHASARLMRAVSRRVRAKRSRG